MKSDEEACFVIVMPGYIDAVLGKLLATGGGGPTPPFARTCRLLRTKLFHPQKVRLLHFSGREGLSSAEDQGLDDDLVGVQHVDLLGPELSSPRAW